MGKEKKSTKNFKKKFLDSQVSKSKELARHRKNTLEKTARRETRERTTKTKEADEAQLRKELEQLISSVRSSTSKNKDLGSMSVDDFMSGGFEDISSDENISDESGNDTDAMEYGSDGDNMDDDDDDMGLGDANGVDDDVDEIEEDDDMDEDSYDLPDEYDDSLVEGGVFERFADDSDLDEDDDENDMSIEAHKAQLLALKEQDPEFYEHLMATDKGLLNFGDDVQESEDEEETPKKQRSRPHRKYPIVRFTKEQYQELRTSLNGSTVSFKSLFKVVKLFKSAVAVSKEVEDQRKMNVKKGKDTFEKNQKLDAMLVTVTSSKLYSHFMQYAIKTIPVAIMVYLAKSNKKDSLFAGKSTTSDISAVFSEGPVFWTVPLRTLNGWKKIEPLVRYFMLSYTQYVSQLIDPLLIRYSLRSVLPVLPLLEEVPTVAPKLLKIFLQFWSVASDSLDSFGKGSKSLSTDHATRIDAFLAIRRMCLTLPPKSQVLEATLKGAYLTYVRCAKQLNVHSMPTVAFLSNCITELYAIDHYAAYQHAFIYIRQLAIHLRSALTAPSERTVRSVYNWQFINCLRVWAQVISKLGADQKSVLFPLAYPLLQICLGVIELQPSPAYFNVRFYIADFINQIVESTKVYVPLAPYLLTVFNTPLLLKKGKESKANKANEIKYKLHSSDTVLGLTAFQTMCIERSLNLLAHHLSLYSHSIAFPEIAIPVKFFLKRFAKHSKSLPIARAARQLLSAIHETAQVSIQKRTVVSFCPRDMLAKGISGIDTFQHPDLVASLNNSASNKFAGRAGKTGGIKKTPLESLWEVRKQAMLNAEKTEVVVSLDSKPAPLEEDDMAELDDEDDVADEFVDDFEEAPPKTVTEKKSKDAKDTKSAKPVSKTLQMMAAAAAAANAAANDAGKTKRPAAVLENNDDDVDDDDDEPEDQVQDFQLSDWSEAEQDDQEDVTPVKKSSKPKRNFAKSAGKPKFNSKNQYKRVKN